MTTTLSPEQQRLVREDFRRRRGRQIQLAVIAIPAIVALAWLKESGRGAGMGPAGAGGLVALVLAAVAFSFWNWRCPACQKYLGKGISPAFCAKCGVQLQER